MVHTGKSEEILPTIPDNSVDSIVTDPPAGIAFMGKEWDEDKGGRDHWIEWITGIFKECYRVLKPGGHALVWALPRTSHWTATALENAGFQVRDLITYLYDGDRDTEAFMDTLTPEQRQMLEIILSNHDHDFNVLYHIFGSGFPKSHDVSKAIDREAGVEREIIGQNKRSGKDRGTYSAFAGDSYITAPATDAAKQWQGWGSALKPSVENWYILTKPLQSGSIFSNELINLALSISNELCQYKSFASFAEKSLGLSHPTPTEGFTAQWIVGVLINTPGGLPVQMDTLQSEQNPENMTLNIGLSWLNILGEALQAESMFTTSMKSSMTTDLKILNSLEWANIFQNITHQKKTPQSTLNADVLSAETLLLGIGVRSKITQEHIVQKSATQNPEKNATRESASSAEKFSTTESHTKPAEEGHACLQSKVLPKNITPSVENWILVRKPLEGTIAQNVLKWGTGGLNIDGCRVETNPEVDDKRLGGNGTWATGKAAKNVYEGGYAGDEVVSLPLGRFPAHLITDGSDVVREGFPETKSGNRNPTENNDGNGWMNSCKQTLNSFQGDSGSASRFFYQAKCSPRDRNEGLDGFEEKLQANAQFRPNHLEAALAGESGKPHGRYTPKANNHPTVKATPLMQYLCTLITPPGGTVLDPFTGSGSTGKGAILAGFQFIGIEQNPEYAAIAEARVNHAKGIKTPPTTQKTEPKPEKSPSPDNQLTLF